MLNTWLFSVSWIQHSTRRKSIIYGFIYSLTKSIFFLFLKLTYLFGYRKGYIYKNICFRFCMFLGAGGRLNEFSGRTKERGSDTWMQPWRWTGRGEERRVAQERGSDTWMQPWSWTGRGEESGKRKWKWYMNAAMLKTPPERVDSISTYAKHLRDIIECVWYYGSCCDCGLKKVVL